MLDGERPIINGDGATSRDFTHVENVIHANLAAAEQPQAGGRVFNVAMGESHTLNELVSVLNELLERELEPLYGDPRPGDVPESLADVTAARDALGYQPTVNFVAGLRRTIDWIAASRPAGERPTLQRAS
jgi:nucleoside-diphosphate-sugar epimerase